MPGVCHNRRLADHALALERVSRVLVEELVRAMLQVRVKVGVVLPHEELLAPPQAYCQLQL